MLLATATALLLAAEPFPLPTVDAKPIAVQAGQTTFRLPLRFERVRAFYDEQLPPDLATRGQVRSDGRRVLTLTPRGKDAAWAQARIVEGDGETTIILKPVLRMSDTTIEGNGRPLVHFVIGRSPDAAEAARAIDHTNAMMAH